MCAGENLKLFVSDGVCNKDYASVKPMTSNLELAYDSKEANIVAHTFFLQLCDKTKEICFVLLFPELFFDICHCPTPRKIS